MCDYFYNSGMIAFVFSLFLSNEDYYDLDHANVVTLAIYSI
jgi:mannose-1-phosphate guanylyltransferase